MSAIKDLKVYDVGRREVIGTIEHLSTLSGRTVEDLYDSIKMTGGIRGRPMEIRGEISAPASPAPPPPVAKPEPSRSEADKWLAPLEASEQEPTPAPATSPPAETKTPPPPQENIPMPGRAGKPIEEVDANGKVINTWPTAGAAERATGVPTNCISARIRKHGGEYKGRHFRFAGEASAAPKPTRGRKPRAANSSSPTPPPPPPLAPSSPADGSLGVLRNIVSTITSMAATAPGGLLSDVSIGMSSGVSRVEVSVKSISVQVTPVE